MTPTSPRSKRAVFARLGIALIVALAAYLLVYRPLQLRWGATEEEVARVMPGDEIQPSPIFNATRAVAINAPPEAIWPWLVQIGYKRAGWYGYDEFDNAGIPSARRIVPELQHLAVGDIVPVWEGAGLGVFGHRVVSLEANRYLLVKGDDDSISWIWALYPVDEGHTRLVWRQHHAPFSVPFNWASAYVPAQLVTDLADFIAVRHNMLGIKERVEGTAPANPQLAYVELALWLLAFLGFWTAEVGIVAWRDWRRSLAVAVASGLITIFLALLKPPIWVDAVGGVVISAGLWWARAHHFLHAHGPC